jgi:precorrin-6A synthase
MESRSMRKILVIGIGAGNPEYMTIQAVNALNATEVIFLVDKGEAKSELRALREEICERYIEDQSGYVVVEIPEPLRDGGAAGYEGAVEDWHERRAILFERAIAEHLPHDGCGAFLVWGDPAMYDSTLRVIGRTLARGFVDFDYEVIPGITSVQALAAQHRLPLNRIGEPIHITTGRRLAGGFPIGLDSAVVMLDAGLVCKGFDDPALHIYWGAYLGTPHQVLISGRLIEVAADIDREKRELKQRYGWIMDTYLLRRERR